MVRAPLALILFLATAGQAQQLNGVAPPDASGEEVPLQAMSRDDQGRVVIRAMRLVEGLEVDGRLDEEMYSTLPMVTGFVQQVPTEGAPASERTDVWVLYDDANLYVSARCWDSAPRAQWVANELRRDSAQIAQNDTFGVLLDTFHDRRNGFLFFTNPLGALADQQITDERSPDSDWNPVWDVQVQQSDQGWTVEMQIPFKSLRYGPGREQIWGIQLRRVVRRLNEWSYVAPVPISAAGRDGAQGIFRVSAAATLTGLDVPPGSKNLEIKPYGIVGASTNRTVDPPDPRDYTGDLGVDLKYGVTQNLTADVTYNTDFAQVEVDEQQVNLTRFSLSLPEKREFFLESRGTFSFGGSGSGGAPGAPAVFFSRRIGLEGGGQVPIVVGGRLSGKAGGYSIGALNIQTDDAPALGAQATNFTVLRLKRDIFQRSAIGGLFTQRSRSTVADGSNQAYGLDANFSFRENLNLTGYFARTTTPDLKGRDTSHQVRFDYPGDRYGLTVEQLLVGRNFNPEVGFLRRGNFRRNFAEVRFTPRPVSIDWVRQFTWELNLDYTVTADTGELETRQRLFSFEIELENSDRFEFDIVDLHERIDEPFDVSGGTIAPGEYDFRHVEVIYTFGRQRPASGSVFLRRGSFYRGDIMVLEINAARLALTERLVVEPSMSFNWVDLPAGSFTAKLIRARVSYSFTPRIFFSGLLQHNPTTDALNATLRLRWEYRPGSEIFVVVSEDRRTDTATLQELRDRGWVAKVNHLLRF